MATVASSELDELTREAGEDLRTARTEEHVVLDTHASPARSIDARLDCHHRTFRQRRVSRAGQSRCFMHFQAKPMSQAVAEQVAIAALLNVVASDGIGILAGHPRPNPARRLLVRRTDDVIDF